MENKYGFNKKISAFFIAALMVVFTTLIAASANALADTTRPTILSVSVSPANNEQDVSRNTQITVVFSEDMDPSTINANTLAVMQRTTPESGKYRSIAIDETVKYSGRKATLVASSDLLSPNQQYGNVFTVTITSGAKDLAGNSLSRNYVWSFTTGLDPFNTGATTSQQDQSATPVTGFVAAPVTGAEAATANKFPWAWVIGGLLLLLLVALIFISAMRPASQKNKQNIHAKHSTPFGDVHPVIDLEGIGPEHKKELQAIGIKNTKQLWEADAVKVANQTGASLISVRSWQNMAELASVKDIGPQYAELLERSGIHSIGQLKECDPDKLTKLVHKKMDSLKVDIEGNSPRHTMVENWIDQARDHKFIESEGQIA